MNQAAATIKKILLAEDDEDDFLLFRDAVSDYVSAICLKWVKDGEELMKALTENGTDIPDVVFLDINMPRKNGFECLSEIRKDPLLGSVPVVIFSTSNDAALINWMYNAGANLYLCKPTSFQKLKQAIQAAISIDWRIQNPSPPIENFVL